MLKAATTVPQLAPSRVGELVRPDGPDAGGGIRVAMIAMIAISDRQFVERREPAVHRGGGVLPISFNMHSEDDTTYASGRLLLSRLVEAVGMATIRHREPAFFLPCSG